MSKTVFNVASLSELHTSESFVGSSFYEHKAIKNETKYLTSSCVNKISL